MAELAAALRRSGHEVVIVERDDLRAMLADIARTLAEQTRPHYLFCYGVDAAHTLLEAKEPGNPSGLDQLRTVLRHGPEHRTHIFGWWRGVGRLKASLPMGSVEDIGPWVAFDVQGQELQMALALGQVITWSARPGRGLFFDRFAHARPHVIIPFDVTKALPEDTA